MGGLKILYASPEVVPFAKTGGLADVAGALPYALAARGHDVVVMMPRYASLYGGKYQLAAVSPLLVPSFGEHESVLSFELGGETRPVRFVFIAREEYFKRPELYRDPGTGQDWADNDERFSYFARAVLLWCKQTGFRPDIIHVNDWQSALVPAYLKLLCVDDPFFARTRTVLTIHNLAYHGQFPAERFGVLKLDARFFAPLSCFEFWGKVNFLKAGICYADKLNTVSETYAREIQSGPELGCGLDGILRERSNDVYGIVNGIDYDAWSPEKDTLIAANYSPSGMDGKGDNKAALLSECGFAPTAIDLPLIGVISRLDDQKGFDLLAEVAEELLARNFLFVVLGTGHKKYHELLELLQRRFPEKLHVFLAFDNRLAHLIEAGADMFLMPSRYEPCGLNQLYSLKYGTVPVVRKTGGLADTVEDADPARGTGTGFVFVEYTGAALLAVIDRALAAFAVPAQWHKIMENGMRQDFSWTASAAKYERLYEAARSAPRFWPQVIP